MHDALIEFPRSLSSYPSLPGQSLWAVLQSRFASDPFNAAAALIFLLAIVHTFFAARFVAAANREQLQYNAELAAAGLPLHPSVKAELLHFFGEVEVVF